MELSLVQGTKKFVIELWNAGRPGKVITWGSELHRLLPLQLMQARACPSCNKNPTVVLIAYLINCQGRTLGVWSSSIQKSYKKPLSTVNGAYLHRQKLIIGAKLSARRDLSI